MFYDDGYLIMKTKKHELTKTASGRGINPILRATESL